MSDNQKFTDEEIVKKVRSDDRNLYAVIIDRYSEKLLRYATNLVHDRDKAAHIVQDSFVKAYINLNGFNTNRKFSNWIYRIVHNEALNAIKGAKREVLMVEEFDFESEEDLTQEFEKKETIIRVEECLSAIPVLYSEPLVLFYFNEMTYEEISEILRIPIGTVAVRISRAKKLLKKICRQN